MSVKFIEYDDGEHDGALLIESDGVSVKVLFPYDGDDPTVVLSSAALEKVPERIAERYR